MKYLILISLILVACGKKNETPVEPVDTCANAPISEDWQVIDNKWCFNNGVQNCEWTGKTQMPTCKNLK